MPTTRVEGLGNALTSPFPNDTPTLSSTSSDLISPRSCNLMISNLPPLVDEATLLARFEKYGPVLQIKVIRKRSTGCSSYGFVVFRSKEHADQAVVKENGMLWMTKRICVIYAKSESVCDFEIIISHLPLSFSEEQTRAIFSQFGTIVGIRFEELPSSQFQDCYLKYQTIEQCQTVIMLLNGKLVEGASQPIIIQFVDPDVVTTTGSGSKATVSGAVAAAHHSRIPSPRSSRTKNVSYPRAKDVVPSPRARDNFSELMPTYSALHSASPTIVIQDINAHFEYSFLVSGLPPTVTSMQLLSLFAPFGQIHEITVQSTPSFDASQLLCTGTAILRLYGTAHYRDSALGCLHGAFVFPYHTPILVTLYQDRVAA